MNNILISQNAYYVSINPCSNFIENLFKYKQIYDPSILKKSQKYIWPIDYFIYLLKKYCNENEIKEFLLQYPEYMEYFI